MVEFQNVFFKYSDDTPWVLEDCSFSIYENEWVAIIGHNGSGKSTIAKLMNGLLFPEKGTIIINDVEVTEASVWEVRKEVGMVFQNPDNQFVGTTVQDDVAFGMENRGVPRKDMIQRIDQTLETVGMQAYKKAEPHRLSGGQKQRVAIAAVLAIYPGIIILDEATSMLDPIGRKEIMETVSTIQSKHHLSLVTITHDLIEVAQSDRIIVMNQGKIWSESTPRQIFSKREALQNIGLDVPFVSQLTQTLRGEGLNIPNEPLNHKELLEDLWILHSKT